MDQSQWQILQQMLSLGRARSYFYGENTAPGMGSKANAGGYTSGSAHGSYESRPDAFSFPVDDGQGTIRNFSGPSFVPGSAPMPQGAIGTQGGPAMTPELMRYLMKLQGN